MDHGSGIPPYQPPIPDPGPLALLRRMLLGDGALLDRIAALPREDALAALGALAAAGGMNVTPEALAQALRPDPLGLDRFAPRAVTGDAPPSPQWLPAGLGSDGAQAVVEWAHFAAAPLDDPFFEYHLRKARQHPVSRLLGWSTPLDCLAGAGEAGGRVLDGLVFHMSRCGSTLVAQALGSMPGHIVLSEPAPFDELLQFCAARGDIPLEARIALLRGMAAALTSERGAPVRRRFLKTDCWHAGALPLLRAAFPEAPWIFLYRDPVEVLMSHERMPGGQTLPGPHAALVGVVDPAAHPDLDFAARVLAAICHRAADHGGIGGGMLVDYAELPEALLTRILPHFGIVPELADSQAIEAALRRDAKQPRKSFDPQERPPRQRASAAVIAASDRHLASAVARLRALAPRIGD
ncbi:MAG: aspartyl beta-hydroxylase [Porphyrobacter sp.]|nr:aspartyl beta-hydroxylase [Porphyrobacter sp.]